MSEEGIHTENKNIRFGIIVNDIGIDSEEVLVNEINSIVCSTGNNLPVFQTNRLEHNCWMLTYDTEEIAKIAFDLLKDQTINEKPLNPVLVPAGPVEMDYNMMNNMMYYGNYHPMGPYPMPNFDMMGMPAAMNMPMMIYPQVMLDQNGEPMYMPDGMPMPAPMGFPYMNPMDPHVHPNSANEMGSGAAGSSSVNEATSDGQNSTENAGENEGQNSNPYWQGYPPFDMNQYMYALNAAGYDYNSMQYFLAAVNEGIFEPNVLAMMDPNMYSNGYNNSGKGFRRKKSTSDSNLNRRNSEENSNNRERSGDGKNLNSTSADSARNSNRRGTSNINAGGKKNGFAGRGDRNNMNSNSNSDRNRRGGKGRLNKEGEKGSENMKPKKAVSANFNMEEDFPNLMEMAGALGDASPQPTNAARFQVFGYADALKKASIDFSDEQNDTKPDVKSNTNKTNTKRNIPALVPATVIPKPSKQNSTTVNVSGDDQGLTDISSDWVLNKYIDDENSPNARPNKSSNAEISPDITFGSFNDAPVSTQPEKVTAPVSAPVTTSAPATSSAVASKKSFLDALKHNA